MLGPTDNYASLGIVDISHVPRVVFDEPPGGIEKVINDALAAHGLRRQSQQLAGRYLVVARGDKMHQLTRSRLYSLADKDEIATAIAAHIAAIAEKHGPGSVWFLGSPGQFMKFDGIRMGTVEGHAPMYVQATYYGHEKQLVPVD